MRILITGGTGTFGRAAARHFTGIGHTVTIYSRDEHKQEQMAAEFNGSLAPVSPRFFVGDVRDKDRLFLAMRGHDTVLHAAAMKIVGKCEFDPCEAVKTNIGGSQNVVECALLAKVLKVLLVSTDKAVNPVNLYGATKKVAEHLFRAADASMRSVSGPAFGVLRYGNVWRSRGSVAEVWERQHAEGLPITVTDPEMTRFFLTADEAVSLAAGALRDMEGGEVFIPKLRAYSVYDLSSAFQFAYHDCVVKVVGARAGEKTHEELLSCYEVPFIREAGDRLVIGTKPYSGPVHGNLMSSLAADRMDVSELTGLLLEDKKC